MAVIRIGRRSRPTGTDNREAALALLPELAGVRRVERRARHRVVQSLVTLLSLALIAGLFVTGWQFRERRQMVGPQIEVAAPPAPASLAAYRASSPASTEPAAPIVLTYHDIQAGDSASPYVVDPAEFAAQMQMLHAAGFTALTSAEFLDYVHGRYSPPARSVLITFDDGTAGLWTYADRILARYGFHAVSFLITGRVGKHAPYYLTWQEIGRMHASGRWDFESHTHLAHDQVVVSADGERAASLTNRMYVNGALETPEAYEARISQDLRQSITDTERHGLPTPRLFAYPYSSSGEVAHRIIADLFDVSFVDSNRATMPVSRREAARATAAGVEQTVERTEVYAVDTAYGLFTRLQAMTSLPVRPMAPLTVDAPWLDTARNPAHVEIVADTLRITDQDRTYFAANWAPQQTADWSDYAVTVEVTGVTQKVSGGLTVRVGSNDGLTVRASSNRVDVLGASGSLLFSHALTEASDHTVSAAVSEHETTITIDGVQVGAVPTTGGPLSHGGFGIAANRRVADQGFPEFSAVKVDSVSARGET